MTDILNLPDTRTADLQHSSQETAVFLNDNKNNKYVLNETTDETSNESSPDSPTHSDSTETTQVTTTNNNNIDFLKNKKNTNKIMNDFMSKSIINHKKLIVFDTPSSGGTDSDDSCITRTFTKPSIPSSVATATLSDVPDRDDSLLAPFSFDKVRRRSSSLSEAEDDQIAKFRRESIKNYKGMGGVSWGSLGIGAWLKDEIMFNKLQDAITIRLQQEEEQKISNTSNFPESLLVCATDNDYLATFDNPPSLLKQRPEVEFLKTNVKPDFVESKTNQDEGFSENSSEFFNRLKQSVGNDYHSHLKPQASYLPTLEQKYCKDYSCCGISLPSLHDLLNHYEQSHVPGSHTLGSKFLGQFNTASHSSAKQLIPKLENQSLNSGKEEKLYSVDNGKDIENVNSYNVFHNIENKLNLKTISELMPNEHTKQHSNQEVKKTFQFSQQSYQIQNSQEKQAAFNPLEEEDVMTKSSNDLMEPDSIKMQKSYKSFSMSNVVDVHVSKNRQLKDSSKASTSSQFERMEFMNNEKNQHKEKTASPQAISKQLLTTVTHPKIDSQSVVESHENTTESILEEAKALIRDINPISMRCSKSLDIDLTNKCNIDTPNTNNNLFEDLKDSRTKGDSNSFIVISSDAEKSKLSEHNDMDEHNLHSDLDMDALDEADLKVMVELGKITNGREDEDEDGLENRSNGNNDQNNNDDDRNEDENNKHNGEEDEEEEDEDEDDDEQDNGQPPKKKRKSNVKSVGIPDEPFLRSKKFLEEDDKPFRCPVIGCDKAYKNQNGLKYHRAHGHEGQILQENNDGTFSVINPETNLPFNEFVEFELDKPYRCEGCGRRYKNLNGLKYHKAHSTH